MNHEAALWKMLSTAQTRPATESAVTLNLSHQDLDNLKQTLSLALARTRENQSYLETQISLRSQELLDTKNHLQLVIESMSDGLITIDSSGNVASMNATASTITGHDAMQTVGHPISDVLGCPLHAGASDETTEVQINRADGVIVTAELSVRPMVTEQGLFQIVTLRDITEQKRTQKLLMQQAYIIERSDSFVYVTSAEHKLEWCNPKFEQLTGYSLSESIGQTPAGFAIGDGSDEPNIAKIQQAVAEREPFNVEMMMYHRSGKPFWARINAHPIFDDGGNLERYVALGTETTDQRFAAQMQVDFISMVSHELRTPLTVIRGAFEALQFGRKKHTPDSIEMLSEFGTRNCGHLEKLIEDLLDINTIESGTLALSCERFDVALAADQAIQDIKPIADAAHITLELNSEQGTGLVFADPLRFSQILVNLLANAIKFSDAENKVTVLLERGSESIRVSIRDHGRGIPVEFRPMMFRKFSRDSAVRAEGTEGFGLGLSICKRLVEQMHGTIDYESEVGKGTTIFFELPLAKGASRQTSNASRSASPARPSRQEAVKQ